MPRYDDEYDDRPRRRRRDEDDYDRPRRPSGGGVPIGLVVGGGLGLIAVIGVLAILLLRKDNPPPAPVAVAQQNPPAPPPNAPAPQATIPVPQPGVQPVPQGPAPAPQAPPVEPPVAAGPALPLRGVSADPSQIVFGGTAQDGVVGVVSYGRAGGYHVDVAKTATGRAVGKVDVELTSVNSYALSPDGAYLAVVGSAPGDGHPLAVYSVADGKRVGRFTPYPKGGADKYKLPDLVWAAFLGPDQLMTVNESGGYDVWSVPALKRVSGKPSGEPGNYTRLAVNGFTHTPTNFAVTPDGKTLAVLDGTRFVILDPITGNEIALTDPFTAPGSPASYYGTALTADGGRLACFCSLSASGQNLTVVAVWDARTGRRLSLAKLPQTGSAAGLAWLGPDHLALWQGGIGSAEVMAVATGEIVANIRGATGAKFGTVPPDDRLWGVTPGGLLDRTGAGPQLVRDALPTDFRPRTIFDFGPAGLVAK